MLEGLGHGILGLPIGIYGECLVLYTHWIAKVSYAGATSFALPQTLISPLPPVPRYQSSAKLLWIDILCDFHFFSLLEYSCTYLSIYIYCGWYCNCVVRYMYVKWEMGKCQ